ncbi:MULTISPECIES: amidohydrolase [unclassified Streptomyces]|uniref:amidohydrolase n=1 Tax=unclassified Streptomyces TaxID=2593676 RepID=UPI002254E93F|nr:MULTISPECIES: amidohydrolase [unclassified Streptomyces]MCX4528657.1 amidohydrolase [Streptomyces sp. NBC_01551]MCX4540736.1 amidohydrolase [Streptomyces sp. NBC_01565]
MTSSSPFSLSRRGLLAAAGAAGAAGLLGAGSAAAAPSAASAGGGGRGSAALVFRGARVFTGLPGGAPVSAVAVGRDGKILATGSDAALRRCVGRDTEVVDARGNTLMSGIHDGHVHPLGAGDRSLRPSLEGAETTVAELREILTGFLADTGGAGAEPDGWLVVEDWNPVGLLPTGTAAHHSMLDALATRRPIALVGGDGHNLWANGRALDIAGITAATPDPVGGKIVKGADGRPTGVLKDDAQELLKRHIPEPSRAELVAACAKVLGLAAASGVTTMMDALVGRHELELYQALAAQGGLPQRIVPAIRLDAEQAKDPAAALAYARGLRREFEGVRGLRFGMVKVFLDGVIEYPAQTAALLKPYLDGNGKPTANRGELYTSATDYGRLTAAFNKAGWQMHAHGLGDRAVRTALDGYAYARRATGQRDPRNAIAHLQIVDPADLRRFAQLGVAACMQLQWAARDTWTVEALLPYIGPERHRWMYPARSLEKAGARLTGGSDWPVDALQVWNQLRTAVDRQGVFGAGELYRELEGLSRGSALRMHTAGTAWQLRQESLTGTVEAGKAADLVLLDRDVTRCPVADISGTGVRMTLVGGRVVHDADSAAGRAAAGRVARGAAGPRPASYSAVHGGRHRACGCAQGH